MAQHDMNIANQGFPAFRSDLNNALSAIQTNHSGTSRPTGAVAGQIWLDTTNATNPTLKFFDGTDDISLATIDYSANTVNWLDSTVSVTGLATTATGTVLTLSDTATTQTVNFIIDNEKEIRFSEADGNGSNYVALKAPASLASDVTFTLPSADGTADQVLKTDGSGNLSFTDVSGGISWQSSIVTGSTLTAVVGNGYWIDTTSNACTITLPSSANVGDQIIFVDYARTWGTNKITINQNSLNFQGYSSPNPEYNTNGQSITIVYSGATQGWIPTVDDDVTFETPQPITVDFLVIAGGGGGSLFSGCGGSGAGGYRNSYNSESSGGGGSAESALGLTSGETYTITVGAGGSGAATTSSQGNTGSNSSISGTGITTITSIGGGSGNEDGSPNGSENGGSGGGSTGSPGGAGSGTANQGYDGGNGGGPGYGSGGGGAGAVGGAGTRGAVPDNYPLDVAGSGGTGVASTITGSSITRGGGGGGATYQGTVGSGGSGGGGTGGKQDPVSQGTSGTANTGGGAGGKFSATPSNNGGSGVVILRLATANYSGTTTGSPTVTTDGTDTILVFNASGSYTA